MALRVSAFVSMAAFAAAASAPLFNLLNSTVFLNAGTNVANTTYGFLEQQVFYMEAENVTVPSGSWGISPNPYTFEGTAAPPPPCIGQGTPHVGFDRPGGDQGNAHPEATQSDCAAFCCNTPFCVAWVYASAAPSNFGTCVAGGPCCYPKNSVTPENPLAIVTNALVTPAPYNDTRTPPALGVRSAVPLGGLGAGSFELRGDGTFHEWTIINAYPQATTKLPVQDDAVLSVRIQAGSSGTPATRVVRTSHPPAWAPAGASLPAITYSGAYPLSRLDLSADPALGGALAAPAVYAYSPFKPGKPEDAAHPAAAFSLAASNPAGAADSVTVSFMLQLPVGAWSDCARTGANVLAVSSAIDAAACVSACAAASGCLAWDFNVTSANCTLYKGNLGAPFYNPAFFCGVAGTWTSDGETGAITLRMTPPGAIGFTDASAGDVTLVPVAESGGGATCTTSAATAAHPGDLFTAFSASGSLGGVGVNATAGHGAVAVTCSLPPGGSVALSAVFAWYFPNRTYGGEIYGNFYTNLWPSSAGVAASLASADALAGVVGDISAHHSLFFGSSLPVWLADTLVNEFSHFRQMLWTQQGFLRMDEAMDCPDLDSVHNDYQRHLPYLWYVPRFEQEKWQQYAILNPAGYVNENPGFAPGQQGGGRIMADTTTIWLLELWELYRHTGDSTLITQYWPQVVTATKWQIQASALIGLPWKLVCTYDILAMEQYNTTTFNGVLHLAAMRAVEELCKVKGDNATAALASAALAYGQASMQSLLWNSTYGYYRAYTGGDAIMVRYPWGHRDALIVHV